MTTKGLHVLAISVTRRQEGERTKGARLIRGQCVFGSLSPRCRHKQLEVNNETVTPLSISFLQSRTYKIKFWFLAYLGFGGISLP